jgi:DNA-binding GntR family transcriptional regulator
LWTGAIAELRMIQSTYDRYTVPGHIAVRIKLHVRIYRLAGNEDAREIIYRHSIVVRVLTHRYNHSRSRIERICGQHCAIIAAIASGNSERGGEIAA